MTEAAVSPRYAISHFLRDSLNQDQHAYMTDLDRFFTEKNALSLVVEGIPGATKGNLLSVLRCISNATLGWCKPFERLSRLEFTKPREAGGTFIPTMSERTAVRALNALEQAGLICRFRSKNGSAVHYGLCLGAIFARMAPTYTDLQSTCSKSQISLNMWHRLAESQLLTSLDAFIRHFAGKVISGIEEVRQLIEKAGELMASLVNGLKAAKAKAKQISGDRKTAKAAQPFFKPDGSPNPVAALEFWNKEIRDSELFVGCVPRRTLKTVGMMKNWLIECAREGLGDELIRENIHQYVNRWFYVSDADRSMTVISKAGRPYECRLEYMPDFEFFYANRGVIIGILMKTALPGKNSDGTDERMLPDWF